MSYSQTIGHLWNADLGTVLVIAHNPETHRYKAVDWKSEKLLKGIVGSVSYEERHHTQVLARALEYELKVRSIESTDSMLQVLIDLTEELKKRAE